MPSSRTPRLLVVARGIGRGTIEDHQKAWESDHPDLLHNSELSASILGMRNPEPIADLPVNDTLDYGRPSETRWAEGGNRDLWENSDEDRSEYEDSDTDYGEKTENPLLFRLKERRAPVKI